MRMSTLRVLILGDNKVGKSAVTVRFLTKRFIGEYSSSIDHVYRSTIRQEDTVTDVEVLDTCSKTCPGIVEESRVQWADAFVVIYSICSRTSFHTARDLVTLITRHRHPHNSHPHHHNHHHHHHHNNNGPSSPTSPAPSHPHSTSSSSSTSCPVLLLANMRDLEHRREVGVEEGHELALEHGCQYYEVSAADSAVSVSIAFQAFLREARSLQQQRTATLKRRRSSLGSVSKKLGAMFGKNSSSSSSSNSSSAKDSPSLSSSFSFSSSFSASGDSERRRMSLTNGHHRDHPGGDSEKRRTSSLDIVMDNKRS